LYHCYFLPVIILFCVKKHIRRWFRDYASLSLATIGVFAYATLFRPGLSAPPGAEITTIRGPWFFLGIQFLLKTFPPLLAGVLMPSIIVLGLCILPAARNQYGKAVYWILVLSVGLYGFISVWSLLRP
jgi:ubiquinol-cytochrome c reductase cytochrome b subunit